MIEILFAVLTAVENISCSITSLETLSSPYELFRLFLLQYTRHYKQSACQGYTLVSAKQMDNLIGTP